MANVVFGAGGGTGLETVKRLLSATSAPVKAVVRDPSKYADVMPKDERLQVVAGDVTDTASLPGLLQGAKGVVFAASGKGYWSASSVDHKGVEAVAAAAKAANVDRVVLVSSMLVTPKNRFNPIRILLNNIRWGLMDEKFKGEEALRRSGVPYTVVRPGGLSNNPGGNASIITGQGDSGMKGPERGISRADVASVCVEALTNPAAKGVTLEIVAKPLAEGGAAAYEQGIKRVFEGLTPDQVV